MLIGKDEFSAQKLYEVYSAAFMEPEMEQDGDDKVVIDGYKVFARVLPDRPFLVLTALFGLKEHASRLQMLELANRFNDRLIVVRACIPEGGSRPGIYFDHYTITEGGISGEEIVALTRRFIKIVADGIRQLDTDDIIT